jgi:hypothetical protein
MLAKIMLSAKDFINATNEPNPEAPISEAASLRPCVF